MFKVSPATLSALCKLTTAFSRLPSDPGLHWARILSGPNAGMYFSMPRLERASFVLGTYERHVVAVMRARLTEGMVAFDVGANAGYFSLVMARLVSARGRVVAFEPDPKNVKALRANIAANCLSNVTCVAKAVSDTSGPVSFATFDYSLVGQIATEHTPDDAAVLEVDGVTLDDYVYENGCAPPHFIKIDVEGAEHKVLYGASRVLKQARPVVVAEVRGGTMWEEIKAFVVAHGYEPLVLPGGEWNIAEHGLGDVLFVPVV